MAALGQPNRYLNPSLLHRMKKAELWAVYVKRNPSFEGEGNITLSKRGLRKLFDTTWDTAYFDGEPDHSGDTNDMMDTIALEQLKSIFGFR
jgi:hypothetical protein